MIVRGYQIIFKVFPHYISWYLLSDIVSNISNFYSYWISALFINELAYSRDIRQLMMLAVLAVGGNFLFQLLGDAIMAQVDRFGYYRWHEQQYMFFRHQNKMQYEHLENAEVTLLRQKMESLFQNSACGLMLLINNSTWLLANFINLFISTALTVSLFRQVADREFTGLLKFTNSPYAALIVVALIIINAVISTVTINVETKKSQDAWQKTAEHNVRWNALYTLTPDAYIFDMKKIVLPEMKKKILRSNLLKEIQGYALHYGSIRHIWHHLMNGALFLFVAAKAYMGAFGIGNFLLYRGTVSKFVYACSNIAQILGRMVQNNDTLALMYEFLDLPDNMYHGTLSVEKRDDNDYEIEFQDVSFKYPKSDAWVLRHVNMKFKVGDKLAIVGLNGSGKSTFIKLMCRLYDPTEGKILLNGIDITRYKYEEYLSIFSVVFQDFNMTAFTIAENVASTNQYDIEKVWSCLERAGLSKKVYSLEHGIETYLTQDYDENGVRFSAGEYQKLAIARALYKDAPFIILDEPTASLDPMAEAEVYSHFNDMVKDKTALYISHRLSSCRFCKHILVFDDGSIVQQGTHEELVSDTQSLYYELWTSQAQYYK